MKEDQGLPPRLGTNRKRRADVPSAKGAKRVCILDENSVMYIEDREYLQKLVDEVEMEEQANNPKPIKKKKRRTKF